MRKRPRISIDFNPRKPKLQINRSISKYANKKKVDSDKEVINNPYLAHIDSSSQVNSSASNTPSPPPPPSPPPLPPPPPIINDTSSSLNYLLNYEDSSSESESENNSVKNENEIKTIEKKEENVKQNVKEKEKEKEKEKKDKDKKNKKKDDDYFFYSAYTDKKTKKKRFYHEWRIYKFLARYKGYFRRKGTINLLGILAFYIELLFPETRFRGNKILYWIPLILSQFLIVRLFLRLTHMKNGFSKHFNIVINCLKDNSKFLFNVYTIFYLGVLAISPIYYHAEIFGSKFDPETQKWVRTDSLGQEKNTSVHSIVESSWWAAVTMVCIGYGDYYPFTIQGKFIAFFGIMFSMFLFLIPNAILYATFADDFSKANRDEAIKNAIEESNKRYKKRQKKMFRKRRESTFLSSPNKYRPRRDEDIDNLYTIPKKASTDDHDGLPEILYMIKNNIKNEDTTIEDISDNEEEIHILKDKDEVESLSSMDSDEKSRRNSRSLLQTTLEESTSVKEISSEKLEEFYDNKEDIINEMMDYCEICDKELVKTSQKLYTLTKMKKYYEILIREYSQI